MFGTRRVYADAAAATPVDPRVVREMNRLMRHYGNPGSIHREGVAAKDALLAARSEAARAIDAHPDELVFTSGGTEANNLALFGIVRRALREGRRGHVVTTSIEHPSVLECVRALEREGVAVSYLPVDEDGLVSAASLRDALRPETLLVSIQYVNSEIGVVQPLREIAKILRDANEGRPRGEKILFHTDASQAPLYLSCRVPELHVDCMTLDGQKIAAPKGVGLLYVKRGVSLMPLILGGGQERGVRSGTENVPLVGAFARALSLAQKDWSARTQRLSLLRDTLFDALCAIPGVSRNGSASARIAHNVNVSVEGCEGEEVVLRLDAKGIAASARSACSMEEGGASYVIEALGMGKERALSSVRLTLLPYATLKDVRMIAAAFKAVCGRMMSRAGKI